MLASAPAAIKAATTFAWPPWLAMCNARDAAEPRRGPEIRAGRQQHLRHHGIAVGSGPVQRGHAVAVRLVDIDALLQQRFDRGNVTRLRSVGHR